MEAVQPTWNEWIRINLLANCNPQKMAQDMVNSGSFTLELANTAIAMQQQILLHDEPNPTIVTDSNSIEVDGRKVEVLMSYKKPNVVLLGNVLTDEECDSLVALGGDRFTRSNVVDSATGNTVQDAGRTSDGMYFGRGENGLIARLENRLATLCSWPVDRGEGLQLQRYGVGREYRPHYDWFSDTPGGRVNMQNGGQRVATFILYLTDVEEGGGTSFPNIGLTVHPKKGCALFFSNVISGETPDPQTLHAGTPVVRGVKVIANKWLRKRQF